jgi:hypothetical protein
VHIAQATGHVKYIKPSLWWLTNQQVDERPSTLSTATLPNLKKTEIINCYLERISETLTSGQMSNFMSQRGEILKSSTLTKIVFWP